MKYILFTAFLMVFTQARAEKLNFHELIVDTEARQLRTHDNLIKENPAARIEQVREKKIEKIEREEIKTKADGKDEVEDLFSYHKGYQKKSIQKQSLQKIGSELDEAHSY